MYLIFVFLEDGTVSVRNVGLRPDGSFTEICGYAEQPDPSHPGELLVRILDHPKRFTQNSFQENYQFFTSFQVKFPGVPDGDYRVLDTDYENWAAIYSCKNILLFKYEFGWILTREPTLNQTYVSYLENAYDNNKYLQKNKKEKDKRT